MKLLFLGKSQDPLSVGCLEVLAASPHQVQVYSLNSINRSVWRLARCIVGKHGWAYLIRKGLRVLRTEVQFAARRLGFRFHSCLSLREIALVHRLEVIESAEFDQRALAEYVRRNRIDAVLVCTFSKILKRPLLDAPRLGCLNIHPSLLPAYRGPDPLYWVLANGETSSGVTIHFMDEGIDTGPILLQREMDIHPGDDEKALLKRAIKMLAGVVPEALALLTDGKLSGTPQDESRATYYSFPPNGRGRL